MSPILESIGSVKGFGWGAFSLPSSFESIASATGTGASGTITFSSIPSTYKHLQIRYIARSDQAASLRNITLQFNSDTAANYGTHYVRGNGATVTAAGGAGSSQTNITNVCATANLSANVMGVGIVDIHDYASTTKNKTIITFAGVDNNDTTNGAIVLNSGLWTNTSAITSISITLLTPNWTTQTQFALYGIKGA